MLQMPRSFSDSLPVKEPSPHKSFLPENSMLAISSNIADTVFFVHLREFGVWSPLLLAFLASAPVLMELCGSRPSTDGLQQINLCLFCPNVNGLNREIAFSSEQLLFLRDQNQFSMTMPRGKAVA